MLFEDCGRFEGYTAFGCHSFNNNALPAIVTIQHLSDSDIINEKLTKTLLEQCYYCAVKITVTVLNVPTTGCMLFLSVF